jgi:transposase
LHIGLSTVERIRQRFAEARALNEQPRRKRNTRLDGNGRAVLAA